MKFLTHLIIYIINTYHRRPNLKIIRSADALGVKILFYFLDLSFRFVYRVRTRFLGPRRVGCIAGREGEG
jgi:hypothetical protein